MTEVVVKSPLQYLDKASSALREMGLMPEKVEPPPITALLEKISDLDQDKIALIARTLGQADVFNEVVREQTSKMEIGERYQAITNGFNSIRDDSKRMVDQVADGKIDLLERGTNMWMKISRGDIADRFDKIRKTYLSVTKETKNQIEREGKILDAYRDYRGAVKHAEVMALEVLKKAGEKLEAVKADLKSATDKVSSFAGTEPSERAKLELARDEQLRRTQDEDKRYQIAKDLSDNLTISYNTSEVIMARLMQTTSAKERVYAQAVTFFSTNDSVLTAMKASFTGMFGLHEFDQDPRRNEGRHVEKSRYAVRGRRQSHGSGPAQRLWADHPRRCRQEARRQRCRVPRALRRNHRRDAQAFHPELDRDP